LQLWYPVAKTVAEETALEYAVKNGLNVVTVCPCIVFGPQLQPVVNTSSELLVYVIKGPFVISYSFCSFFFIY
jgi:nucleoside-diphosphate-sugar epimerase